MAEQAKSIDEYISQQPENVQVILQGIRETFRKALPADATETISYGMPTFDVNGHHIVYFSAWKDHIGIYPLYTDGGEFKEVFAPLKEKNTIKLPFTNPFPYDVVEKFAKLRIKEELSK